MKNKGITLIALVITILVLLILAGVTISTLTGENGLLTKAGDAKSQSEISEEKDIISISAIQAQAENRQGNLEKNNFNEALVANSKSGNKASIIAEDIGSFTVKFESNRYYEVNKDGNIRHIENATGEKILKVQCVNSKNEVLGEYEYTIVADKYSKLPPAIDKYESSEEKIEGEITENKTIQVLYYLICNDDTTLVFTGLDSNGNITTNENEIASYMVGDGSNTYGNGFKEKNIKSIVKIPENYRNKSILKIGTNAFSKNQNIVDITISDSIINIESNGLSSSGIRSLVIGKNVKNLGTNAIINCSNLASVTFKNDISKSNISSGFYNCTNFKEIKIEGIEDKYEVYDNVLYTKGKKELILCPRGRNGEFIIQDTVEKIGDHAFYTNKITSIIMTPKTKKIGINAFSGSSIQEILLGSSVESAGVNAFNSMGNLKTVIIDSKIIAKGCVSNEAFGRLLYNAVNIVYIKSDITEIGSYITDNYNIVETDKEGYVKYVKK